MQYASVVKCFIIVFFITNEEVLTRVGEPRTILETIMARKKKWIRHNVRTERLMKDVIEGRMFGKRPRGRPRIGMLQELKDQQSYAVMKEGALIRRRWKEFMPRTCQMSEHQ